MKTRPETAKMGLSAVNVSILYAHARHGTQDLSKHRIYEDDPAWKVIRYQGPGGNKAACDQNFYLGGGGVVKGNSEDI